MTHFRSDSHRDRHGGMNGELRAARATTAKRGNSAPDRSDYEMYDRYPDDHYNRVYDYQRVPSSVPVDPSPVKRPRPSSSSSSSSSTAAALRVKRRRASSRGSNRHASSSSDLKKAELLSIKRELTVIKLQIDGLLDCVDQMDRQRKDGSECPQGCESSVSDSPHLGSVSSLERESPEPGEASEDEHYCPYRIKTHRSDLEDDL